VRRRAPTPEEEEDQHVAEGAGAAGGKGVDSDAESESSSSSDFLQKKYDWSEETLGKLDGLIADIDKAIEECSDEDEVDAFEVMMAA
jgi:hypothetical protein